MACNAVLTVAQMRAAEQAAMDAGTSEWELMQRAGEGAALWVARVAAGRSVCVMCGPGNNGGDGYVIAEYLRRRGRAVSVVAPNSPKTATSSTAQSHFKGGVAQGTLPTADVFVDCLFGYGLSRKVEGQYAELLEQLRAAKGYKIAIDVPSSLSSDTGELLGPAVQYDLTIALGAWKRAHFVMPAMARMGAKRLVDIGLGLEETHPKLSSPPRITAPAPDAHKYRRGLVAIIGGEMPGAAALAAQAASRAGAGYVKLFGDLPPGMETVEIVAHPMISDPESWDDRIAAFLVGPGLGRSDAAKEIIRVALAAGKPTILDADALHLLTAELLASTDPALIGVTPHEGELQSLCRAFGIDASNKHDAASKLHEMTSMTVLAKGPDTVLAGVDGLRFFPQGSSWLSVAGSGDVLAGIAASRLALGGGLQTALEEAVWLHHEAARLSGAAFTAGDLANAVKPALESFL